MITTSDSIAKLAADLCKAQGALSNPTKDATANIGAGRAYHYAQLSSVIDHCRPVLAKHNLAISQHVNGEPGVLRVTTLLLHASGEYLSSDATIALPQGATPQQLGSAVTYLRRYGVQAVLGIAAEDDDDGASASQPAARSTASSAPARPPQKPAAKPSAQQATGDTEVWSGVTIQFLDEKTAKNGGTMTACKFSNGQRASTFDAGLGAEAKRLKAAHATVDVVVTRKGEFYNIAAFAEAAGDDALGDEPPADAYDEFGG